MPAVLFGTPQAPSPKGNKPRILASGKVRERILCEKADLLAIDPKAPVSVMIQALRIVDGTNLDDHHFDDIVRFGAALQAEHGKLTEEVLALADNEVLATAKRRCSEMLQRLEKLDPNAVFGARGGVLNALKAFATGRKPEDVFVQLYPKIQALAKNLEASAPDIKVVAEKLRRLIVRYTALDRSLAAHVLAGTFIFQHVTSLKLPDPERQAHYLAQSEAIETRVASLLATKATIEVGRRTLDIISRNVDALGMSGQDLLREELPAWHTAYSAALMAARLGNGDEDTLLPLRNIHTRIVATLRLKG